MTVDLESIVISALWRQQLVLHVLARLGARAWLLISPFGWADSSILRGLVCVFMIYDLWLALAIRRGRVSLPARWLMDTADVTIWAILCPATAPYTAAVVVAAPLLLIIPTKVGVRAAVAAAAGMATVIGTARIAIGAEPFLIDTMMYFAISIGLGAVLMRLLRGEASRQQEQAHIVNQAELVAAALAGRNEVVTGIGRDAIDDLQTTIMQLSLVQVDAAAELRKAVSLHKLELGEQTRTDAVYLRDALDAYAADRRADEPAVARHVFFDVDSTDAVQVLSRRQAEQLVDRLEAGDVCGEVAVRVLARRPREPVVIAVGQTHITLESIRQALVRLTIAPVAIVGLAMYVLSMSNTTYTGVPLRLTIPLAAGVLACGVLAVVLIRRLGPGVEPWIAVGALLPFLVIAALTAHTDTVSGQALFPMLGPFVGMALLLGTVVHPRAAVVAAWVALIPAGTAVVWTAPAPPSAQYVVSEFLWPFIAFLGAHTVGRATRRLGCDLSDTLTRDNESQAERQRQRARQGELRYLSDVLMRGESLCVSAEHGPIRTHVVEELRRIRTVLEKQKVS